MFHAPQYAPGLRVTASPAVAVVVVVAAEPRLSRPPVCVTNGCSVLWGGADARRERIP